MKSFKVKAIDAVNSYQALQQFGNAKISLAIAVDIAVNLKALKYIFEAYHNKRNDLVKSMGESIDGQPMQVKPDHMVEFQKKEAAIQDEQLMLKYQPIKTDRLPDDFEVAPNMMAALDWMFEK